MKRISGLVLLGCAAILPGCGPPGAGDLVKAGVSEYQLGRLDKAETMLLRALDTQPSDPEALFYLGRICHDQGSYARALYYYQCCLDADPGYPAAQRYLAEAQRRAGTAGRMLRFIPDVSE